MAINDILAGLAQRIARLEQRANKHEAYEPHVPTCQVSYSGTQATGTGADTAVTFDTDDYDPDDLHSTASNTERITVVVPGVYSIEGYTHWAAGAGTMRRAKLRKNGTTTLVIHTHENVGADITVSTQEQLAAADYIDMLAYQNSGGNLNITKARLALTLIA